MKWIDSLIAWFAPTVLVDGTPWRAMWVESDRRAFVNVARVFFPLAGVAYLAHYFFYDIPNGLEPLDMWLLFRMGMATLCLVTSIYYFSRLSDKAGTRIPAVIACWIICQSQAYVAAIHGLESWVFCFVLVVTCVLVLRLSAVLSLGFALLCISTQASVLLGSGLPLSYVFTGTVVTCVITTIVRIPYLSEVKNFLLNQQNIAAQKQIIELNLEFSERIRSFIPLVIARRLERSIEERRMSVMEASIEVMAPKKKMIACLFSDIRGFTQGSKDLDKFVQGGVLPEVKACSNAVESNEGIPRKVGDLIFAYFDQPSIEENIIRSLVAGIEVARLNHDMNKTFSNVLIKRYVLLSYGEAVVGNLGGAGSSIEITALGTPVNILSRIDDATKELGLRDILDQGDLVFPTDFANKLESLVPSLAFLKLSLTDLNIKVRDFPEIDSLAVLKPSDGNYESAKKALDEILEDNRSVQSRKKKIDADIAA